MISKNIYIYIPLLIQDVTDFHTHRKQILLNYLMSFDSLLYIYFYLYEHLHVCLKCLTGSVSVRSRDGLIMSKCFVLVFCLFFSQKCTEYICCLLVY